MATRYWVGGSGNWSDATNHWAATSNGAPAVGNLPTSADDVVFDQNSNTGTTAFTVTVDAASVANCLSFSTSALDGVMTLAGTAALNVYGSFTLPASNFTFSYSGTLTFRATATNRTITSAGNTFACTVTFNHTAGVSYILQDAMTVSSTTLTLTTGTLDLNNFTLTCVLFNSNNSNTRSIAFGTTGKILSAITSTSNPFLISTTTGFTFTGTSNLTISGNAAAGVTRTVQVGSTGGSASIAMTVNVTAGSDNVTMSGWVRDLNFTGFTGTLNNATLSIVGTLTLTAGMSLAAGVGIVSFVSTGSQSITSLGKTFDFPVTFNGVGGTFTLQDALTLGSTRTATLTNGTLALNNFTLTCQDFSSSNSNTRAITFGTTGKILIPTTTTTTVVSMATMTNFTFTGTSNITLSGNASAVTRTVTMGTTDGTGTNALTLNVTAGSDTIALSGVVRDAVFTGSTVTLANNTLSIFGTLTLTAGMTLTAGANSVTFASTGSQSITSLGKTFDFPVTFNGVGGTFTLQDALTLGSTRTATLTNGTLALNNFTLTCQDFSSSNSNTRAITFGTTGKILIPTTTTTTVVSMATMTNFTFTGTSNITLSGNASAVTRTVTMATSSSGGSAVNALSVNVTAGSDTISVTGFVRNLNFTGSTVTLANNFLLIAGTLTLTAGMTLTAGTNTVTFASTGSQTITTFGKTFDFPVIFDGVGGTWTLQDALTVGATRTTTLTNGTLALNNLTLTTGIFSSTNSNTRAITFGTTGSIVVTATATATVIDMTTMTGFTFTGTPTITVNGAMVTGTRTIIMGTTGGTESNALNLSVTAGAGSLSLSGVYYNLIMNGFTGTLTNTARTIYGILTLNTGYTITTGTNATTFAATSGTQYIVTNGISIPFPITVNSPGATFQLQTAMTLTTNGTFTLTAGTLDLNNYTLTVNGFDTSNANVRSLYLGTGDYLVITGSSFTHRNDTNLTITGNPTVYVTGLSALNTDTRKLGIKVSSACPNILLADPTFNPLMSILDLDLSNWAVGAGKIFDIYAGGNNDDSFRVYGNLTMNSGNIIKQSSPNPPTYFVFAGTAATTKTITCDAFNGCGVWFDDGGVGASWQLNSNMNVTLDASTLLGGTNAPFRLYRGTLYVNNYDVTFKRIIVESGFTLYMGSGTWTSNNATTTNGQDMITINSTSCYAQTCSISTSGTSNVTSVANLYNVTTDAAGGTFYFKSSSANINSLVSSAGVSRFYMCNTTFANLYLTGTASLPCTLARANTTATLTLTQTTGTAFVEHCNINSTTVTGGATWRGQNCTNANNIGWTVITDQKTYGQNGFFGFLTGL